MNEIQHAPQIWVDGARLHHVIIIVHAIDLEEPGETEHRVGAEMHLHQVQRQQRQQIEHEGLGLEVVAGQLSAVVDHQALLQIAGAYLHRHVQEENEIGEAVAGEPGGGRQRLQLRQALTNDQRPEIVENAGRQQHQPVIIKVLVRIDDGFGRFLGPPWPSTAPTAGLLVVVRVALALAGVEGLLTLRYLPGRESLQE